MAFGLALVLTAGLHFYIARVRITLAELPSANQVNLRCRPGSARALAALARSRGPPSLPMNGHQVGSLTAA